MSICNKEKRNKGRRNEEETSNEKCTHIKTEMEIKRKRNDKVLFQTDGQL